MSIDTSKIKTRFKSELNYIIKNMFEKIIMLIMIMIVIFVVTKLDPETKMYGFDKTTIKTEMEKTIKNGGNDLSSIKHIYDNRKISRISNKGDDYYAQDYSLSKILYDLKIEHFVQNPRILHILMQ